MGQRVLITGISRFLGGKLAQRLERDPDVEYVVGVDLDEPEVDLDKTEFVREERVFLREIAGFYLCSGDAEVGWNHEDGHNLFVPLGMERFFIVRMRRLVSCLSKQNWKNQSVIRQYSVCGILQHM